MFLTEGLYAIPVFLVVFPSMKLESLPIFLDKPKVTDSC